MAKVIKENIIKTISIDLNLNLEELFYILLLTGQTTGSQASADIYTTINQWFKEHGVKTYEVYRKIMKDKIVNFTESLVSREIDKVMESFK